MLYSLFTYGDKATFILKKMICLRYFSKEIHLLFSLSLDGHFFFLNLNKARWLSPFIVFFILRTKKISNYIQGRFQWFYLYISLFFFICKRDIQMQKMYVWVIFVQGSNICTARGWRTRSMKSRPLTSSAWPTTVLTLKLSSGSGGCTNGCRLERARTMKSKGIARKRGGNLNSWSGSRRTRSSKEKLFWLLGCFGPLWYW